MTALLSFAARWFAVSCLTAALLAVLMAGWKRERRREEWNKRLNDPNRRRQAEAIARAVSDATNRVRLSRYATPGYRGALRKPRIEVGK